MRKSENVESLVTAKEAVELSYKNETIGTAIAAKAIADEWREGGAKYPDATFDFYCMLGAIYTAGYICGKREERQKKKTRAGKEATR